jgi:hypothetical protein
MRNAFKALVEKPDEKRPREISRDRCENNFELEPEELFWEDVVWITLSQGWDSWVPCGHSSEPLDR